MLKPNLKLISSIVFTAFLTACGGGGGGKDYSPTPGSSYSSTAYSSIVSSSSLAISSSSAPSSSSSVASSSSSSEASIDRLLTNIGLTWIAKGSVDVLVPSGTDLLVQSQNRDQLTLYVFDNDAPGQSACTSNQCLTTWPPLLAKDSDVSQAPLSIITRGDGHKQWALRDKPLYFFKNDTKAGDILGEGVGTIWHVALTEPVLLNKPSVNDQDGDYFVSSGNDLVGIPNGDNTAFAAERRNRDGFSLYTFDNDTDGVSNCNGGCLAAWPPLLADENDVAIAPYSIIDRAMGTSTNAKQWAYHGRPLYYFASDSLAGQTNGKAISKWHLARPQPFIVKNDTTLGSLLIATGLVESATPTNDVETTYYAARHGFTLYTFDNDTAGTSNCSGTCLTSWPALIANEDAVAQPPYSLITRASGEKQWALNDMPLYFFLGDTAAGQTNGEGVGGKWLVARGAPVAVSNHTTEGKIFIGHGNLITAIGTADTAHTNFTLYNFNQDVAGSGQSTCNGSCVNNWPPLYANTTAQAFGDFSIVTRNSGEKQWAYKGKPLYFYVGDSAAGDVHGEYSGWVIAHP